MILTETEDGGEQGVADLEGESHGSTLVVVLDPHRDHVQEDQHEDGNLKPAGEWYIVEEGMIWVLRSLYHFLGLFPTQFFHRSVIVLLTFCEEHF